MRNKKKKRGMVDGAVTIRTGCLQGSDCKALMTLKSRCGHLNRALNYIAVVM